MIYSALGKKLTDRETPFRAGWGWTISGLTMALIGASPLLLYIGFENLTGSSGENPIGLGLLAMAGVGLSQLCILIAIIGMGYGVFQILCFPTS